MGNEPAHNATPALRNIHRRSTRDFLWFIIRKLFRFYSFYMYLFNWTVYSGRQYCFMMYEPTRNYKTVDVYCLSYTIYCNSCFWMLVHVFNYVLLPLPILIATQWHAIFVINLICEYFDTNSFGLILFKSFLVMLKAVFFWIVTVCEVQML
jgi:hypothetical protein